MKRSVFKIILMLVLFLGISCNVNAAEKNWTVSSGITESEEVKGATYVVFSGKGEVNITKSAATYIKIAKDAEIILNLNGYTIFIKGSNAVKLNLVSEYIMTKFDMK